MNSNINNKTAINADTFLSATNYFSLPLNYPKFNIECQTVLWREIYNFEL